jgi:hypothetical protein
VLRTGFPASDTLPSSSSMTEVATVEPASLLEIVH